MLVAAVAVSGSNKLAWDWRDRFSSVTSDGHAEVSGLRRRALVPEAKRCENANVHGEVAGQVETGELKHVGRRDRLALDVRVPDCAVRASATLERRKSDAETHWTL